MLYQEQYGFHQYRQRVESGLHFMIDPSRELLWGGRPVSQWCMHWKTRHREFLLCQGRLRKSKLVRVDFFFYFIWGMVDSIETSRSHLCSKLQTVPVTFEIGPHDDFTGKCQPSTHIIKTVRIREAWLSQGLPMRPQWEPVMPGSLRTWTF